MAVAALIVLCGRSRPVAAEPVPQPIDELSSKATSSADYDELLDRALDAFDVHDYARARALFERAYELRPNARVLRGLGIAALHLKRFSVARRELTAALVEPKQPLTGAQRAGVTQLLSWMQAHLGALQLRVQPDNAEVTVDGEPLSERVLVAAPGAHRIRVSSDGYTAQERAVQLTAGQEDALEISLLRRPVKSAPPLSAASAASADVTDPAKTAAASATAGPQPRSHAPLRPTSPERAKHEDDRSSSVLASPWFWAAVGAVVAGGVITTVALTSSPSSKEYEKGGLGGVIVLLGRSP
jgi:hypothetical protein